MYEYGFNLGMGFQLKDDLLDVYAEQAKFGKQVGGDIIANKKTYLLITALEMANSEQRSILESWLNKKEFDPDEKVKAVRNIYDEIGINNLAHLKMNQYFDRSFQILENLHGSNSAKEVIRGFAEKVISREK